MKNPPDGSSPKLSISVRVMLMARSRYRSSKVAS
jgi:hypothetical protein